MRGICMFKKSKMTKMIADFYTLHEGKYMLQLGEVFLDDMYQKIKNKTITNFTKDYASYTPEYEFVFRFTGMTPSTYSFHIYDRKTQERMVMICYLSGSRCFSDNRDYAKIIEGKTKHIFSVHTVPWFQTILEKVKRIDSVRIEDIHSFSSSSSRQPEQEELPLYEDASFVADLPSSLQESWATMQSLVQKALPVLTQAGDTESIYQLEKLTKEDHPQLLLLYTQLNGPYQQGKEEQLMEHIQQSITLVNALYDKHATSSFEKQLHIFKERYKNDSF